MKKRQLVWIASALLLACGLGADVPDISADALLSRSGDSSTLVLDVRTPEEYAEGHVPGAVNIPHDELASRVGELAAHRGDDVVVYCERGVRALRAAATLADAGYEDVLHLEGDMSAWRSEGRPTER